MKVKWTYLVAVAAAAVAGCAQKGFVIPDDPIDRSVVGSVPASVDAAITAFNTKDYASASLAWQAVLSGQDAAQFGAMAEYYLAESLFRMKLIQASQYFFQSVLLKGPTSPSSPSMATFPQIALQNSIRVKDEAYILAPSLAISSKIFLVTSWAFSEEKR